MIVEELLDRYAVGERSFAGILVYAEEYAKSLEGKSLVGVNLCGSTLDGDWSGVDLAESRMCGLIVNGCDFLRASFRKANLAGAVFTQCDMNGSDFTDAFLCGTAFKQTEVCNSNLMRADLRGSLLAETGFENSNLAETNLQGAEGLYIEGLERLGCNLTGARLPNGTVYSASQNL